MPLARDAASSSACVFCRCKIKYLLVVVVAFPLICSSPPSGGQHQKEETPSETRKDFFFFLRFCFSSQKRVKKTLFACIMDPCKSMIQVHGPLQDFPSEGGSLVDKSKFPEKKMIMLHDIFFFLVVAEAYSFFFCREKFSALAFFFFETHIRSLKKSFKKKMSTKYLGGVKESFINAVGTELCWGWSPAVDFIAMLNDRVASSSSSSSSSSDAAPAADDGSSSNAKKSSTSSSSSKKGGTAPAAAAAVTGFDEDGFPIISEVATTTTTTAKTKTDDEQEKSKTTSSNDKKQQDSSSSSSASTSTTLRPINILLVGACDVRHIIMTLARMKRTSLGKSNRPVHFYVFEPSLRVHCRHLLFLQLLLVDLVTLSELEDRVSVVLDIFGNSLLRDASAGALKSAALAVSAALDYEEEVEGDDDEEEGGSCADQQQEAKPSEEDEQREASSSGDDTSPEEEKKKKAAVVVSKNNKKNKKKKKSTANIKLASWLDWTHMKTKERDFIASQVSLWTRNRTHVDIISQWDDRVRTELAERYDNRVNLFDWDFHFNLLDYSNLLRFPEYREFRKIGQAFDYCRINPRRGFRYDYTIPNKSLAQFNAKTGNGIYLGDVKNGPFYAIGHDIENPHLKKREIDGTTIYGCGVIAMHTVRSWLYELVTGNIFPTDIPHKHAWEDDKNYNMLPPNAPEPHVEYRPEVPPCKMFMVGLDIEKFVERIAREQQRQEEGFFDAAFVGSTSSQFMALPNFFKIINSAHGVVVAETMKFVVDARDDAKEHFEKKIVDDFAKPNGWRVDEQLTNKLHENQNGPKPRAAGVELDNSARRAIQRSKVHHQIVLVKN